METLVEKSVPFECKVRLESKSFEGYASTFGNMDLVGDIIEPGAFRKTITERGPNGANKIKVLWEHSAPFGMPVEMREDANGLYVVGKASDTVENKDRLTYMAEGVVDSMSIGFSIPQGKSWWEEDEDAPWGMVRHITEAKLYEFSPVMFPANEQAAIANVRKNLELQMLLKSFGKEDMITTGLQLKNMEGSMVDEAISALRELKSRFDRLVEGAPALATPSGTIVNGSIGSADITSGTISTTTTVTPVEVRSEPPVDEVDTDPEEAKEALQSVLMELALEGIAEDLK